MSKTIMVMLFVVVFAFYARAGAVYHDARFTTGTSFENQENGVFSTERDDEGVLFGTNFWLEIDRTEGAAVSNYTSGAAYDYASKGTVRNTLFNAEPLPAKGKKGANDKFLYIDLDTPIERLVLPRQTSATAPATNVLVKTSYYDGLYADTLVRLTTSISAPTVDEADKVIIWMQEISGGGKFTTNLMVTAGRYVGNFEDVEPVNYIITSPVVTAGQWCRVTLRAVANVTTGQSRRAPAFTIYFDGKPAIANAAYDVGSDYRTDWMTPEARLLVQERRLFPWLAKPGLNKSMALTRMAFSGQGGVDDVSFSTECPDHVTPDNVFTVKWDLGVKAMTCIVSTADGVVTNDIDALALPRFRDFALGTNHFARVTVTNVVFDTAHDYSNGVWQAKNDCVVTNNVFTYNGANVNPIGFVTSSRDVIAVGAGGYETFAEARMHAKSRGIRTLILSTNLVISTGTKSGGGNDKGLLTVEQGDDLILDLNGHILQGRFKSSPTVNVTGGRLRITDSVGGGAVMPPTNGTISVRTYRKSDAIPEIVLDAGRYDGEVKMDGVPVTPLQPEKLLGSCIVEGGLYTNVTDDAQHFYLEQYVTNTTLYFCPDASNYWSAAEAGYIWSGAGADTRWSNAANWRCKAVPGAADVVIFPVPRDARTAWDVDFGEGVDVKRFTMDAHVRMTGTNDFTDVVTSGSGRFTGTGLMAFTGRLPGRLLGDADDAGEVRLLADWAGVVRIAKVTAAQILRDITLWGTAKSKVEFAGVRGYLSDPANYAMTYELVLTDDGETPAWRNDTGYTGSVVSFPRLSGTGTFKSPANLREIMQVFQFRDVCDFTGRFVLGGKRLVLGSGSVSTSARTGYYTFSEGVQVRSGKRWEGVSACFGTTLGVLGAYDDILMTFSGAAPSVEGVKVHVTDAGGTVTTGRLEVVGTAVVIRQNNQVTLNGVKMVAANLADEARSGSTINLPAGSAVTICGNDVIVNGEIVSTVADYYKVTPLSDNAATYSVQFNEEEVKPEAAGISTSVESGVAQIAVENAKPGLWYGLERVSSLAEEWQSPTEWVQATEERVILEKPVSGAANFFRVVVTDDPEGGVQ